MIELLESCDWEVTITNLEIAELLSQTDYSNSIKLKNWSFPSVIIGWVIIIINHKSVTMQKWLVENISRVKLKSDGAICNSVFKKHEVVCEKWSYLSSLYIVSTKDLKQDKNYWPSISYESRAIIVSDSNFSEILLKIRIWLGICNE